jgi:hypothetical protein
MANWIIHRPHAHCHAAEIRVAEYLKELDDRWTVIWGYFYRDDHGHDREGDFLVLGPAGGLLVLEVKSSIPRWFSSTGQWEGETGNPVDQLMKEWRAIRRLLEKAAPRLWITKALCVPGEVASRDQPTCAGIPRQLIVLRNDLDHWLRTWLDLFGGKVANPVLPPQRDAVLAQFGASIQAVSRRGFLDHTEQLFQRQLTARFALLDQLRENRQLLVRGGTGTGKSWHALEQTFRYAQQGEGRRVLLLVYNLALTAQFERLVAMRKLDRGEVVVRSWEALFNELAATGGTPPVAPKRGKDEIQAFYESTLPCHVLALAGNPDVVGKWPIFDALVVDEGQDQDTVWPAGADVPDAEQGGWWRVYQLLLREGRDAPAGVFYDPAQRPPFRDSGRFNPATLTSIWSQPAHVHLQPAVRYTRPLWSYLQDHRHPAINLMIEALGRGDHLPEGPVPVTHPCDDPAKVVGLVEEIIFRWQKEGLCHPEEVLILHKQSTIGRSPLGTRRELCGRNLREVTEPDAPPDSILHTSINKAKGLDARAVILIGLPPLSRWNDDLAYTWFIGASRARQLLAVIETVTPGEQ